MVGLLKINRYKKLDTRTVTYIAIEFEQAFMEAQESDAQEIEAMRLVTYTIQ